jgi:hypothetical protein
MIRRLAIGLCVVLLSLSVVGLTVRMLSEPSPRMVTPVLFYGLSLLALMKPHIRALTALSLVAGLLFLSLGMYSVFVVANSGTYHPAMPVVFVILPAVFVVGGLLVQALAPARARA